MHDVQCRLRHTQSPLKQLKQMLLTDKQITITLVKDTGMNAFLD
jgi:hypothetical protein